MQIIKRYHDAWMFAAFLLLFVYMMALAPDVFGAAGPDVKMTKVKGGCYTMGDDSAAAGNEEKPAHEVCVDDFQLGTYEVTEAQWLAVMQKPSPSGISSGADFPVRGISWNDAKEFLNILNSVTGLNYRLPTEAEWEYAAKNGKQQIYAGTSDSKTVAEYACFAGSCKAAPLAVGHKKPNSHGIYDMSGNVMEWVNDRFDSRYYKQSPKTNPKGDPFGVNRVLRGGSYNSVANQIRTTCREYLAPDIRKNEVGFRLALTPLP